MDTAQRRETAVCPTDDEAVALEKKKPHKQSFEYIWRTGVAGGLAGSAVCIVFEVFKWENTDVVK